MLGKSPLMNMENYPYEIWTLHRKLFHRFMKYRKYFVKATSSLPEYNQVKVKKEQETVTHEEVRTTTSSTYHVICLLSSSEGEVSEDDEVDNSVGDSERDV